MKKTLFIGFFVGLSLSGFAQKQIKQYEYWFDNNYQAKIAINITPTISHVLNATIPTSGLPEGLHTFRIRFQDTSGVWSATDNQFFNKTRSFNKNEIVKCEYWFDNDFAHKKVENVTGKNTISIIKTIDTNDMQEGLRAFQIRSMDKTGAWSVVSSQFFIKLPLGLPIGENKISTFRYWLDKDFAKQKTVIVDPANPLILSNYIVNIPAPAKATPDNYEFYPNPLSGHKITYHTQSLFYSQFKDITDKWSVVTVNSVLHPYSVNILCDSLSNGVPIVKNYPKGDTIHFFMTKAEVGDSLVFKSTKPLVIDIFDPTGKKINTIYKNQSTNDNGFHALLDGEYYALVHGFNSADSISYTLNYTHFPKYCILRYNRKIVESNGTDTLIFKGNGFTKNTKFSLMSGGNLVAGINILCNYLTVVKTGFTFVNTPAGQYDIYVNYGDTTIVIEKGLEVVNSLTHTVLFGDVPMPHKGNYPFAGVYEYDNLILDEGTSLLSYAISQLVIKVKGKMQIGKNVAIRVRNGYYSTAPSNSTSEITKENFNNYTFIPGDGYSLYPETFGKGGNGGGGATGGMGKNYLIYLGYNQYTTLYAKGGSGGGGGGGGFGGGKGGTRGILGVGTAGDGVYGGNGYDNGGAGGFGGYNSIVSLGGGANNIGTSPAPSALGTGAGGTGGGGNGGNGAIFGAASGGNGCGGPGGGGGGYGGGILVIAANEIIPDPLSKPLVLVLGQNGGIGGIGGAGVIPVSNGGDGEKGEDGIVIINTPNQLPNVVTSTEAFGSNSSPKIGGHGLVSGAAKVFYNVDYFSNSIKNVFSTANIGLTIYPNPANDKVYLKTTADLFSRIIICSLTGERLKIVNVFQPITEVDISNLPKGVYLIRLETKEGSNTGKLIKK